MQPEAPLTSTSLVFCLYVIEHGESLEGCVEGKVECCESSAWQR